MLLFVHYSSGIFTLIRYLDHVNKFVVLSIPVVQLDIKMDAVTSSVIYYSTHARTEKDLRVTDIWSEISELPSEAKHGGQWSPKLRQSPYAVFHDYVLRKKCAGGLKPT